ncbi:kinase-like domain-containing protein [Suillus clintonianus]|uniref:kinase-like domain-containing protein n=1 Tax=Suillus clintonianus TaxID=1904413 RepID=UPI001B87EF8A|nr:kinase-like domain-containing protein [Suillus clintonianus]KAG2127978.1 kinase-like domain-containing protein [Suillus clintonianus]
MRYPTPSSTKPSESSRATKHPSRSPKENAAPSKGVHARKHDLKALKTRRASHYDPKPPRITVHGLPGYTGGILPPDAVDPRPPALPLDGFECIRTLGDGAYGLVLLVRACDRPNVTKLERPGSLFAVKVLSKEKMKMIDQKHPADANAERTHLSELPWSPWVNGVVGAFRDELNLYLMLEFIPSGCFYDVIQTRGPFDAATARFYFANITAGLYFLHGEGIIHRDLKPANILVRPDGYLTIADFGYARSADDEGQITDWMMIGTPLYMSPEVLCYQHMTGRSVDWWAAGVTLYEMLTKRTPFFGTSENKIFKRISLGKYKWPKGLRVGASLKSIVKGLLNTTAEHRLGVIDSVLEHPWLNNIDWDKMEAGRYMAPWVPEVPAPTQTWLNKGLPPPHYLPGLKVCAPAVHREWDDRQPRKKLPI